MGAIWLLTVVASLSMAECVLFQRTFLRSIDQVPVQTDTYPFCMPLKLVFSFSEFLSFVAIGLFSVLQQRRLCMT
jgi:hypothetical protein